MAEVYCLKDHKALIGLIHTHLPVVLESLKGSHIFVINNKWMFNVSLVKLCSLLSSFKT